MIPIWLVVTVCVIALIIFWCRPEGTYDFSAPFKLLFVLFCYAIYWIVQLLIWR